MSNTEESEEEKRWTGTGEGRAECVLMSIGRHCVQMRKGCLLSTKAEGRKSEHGPDLLFVLVQRGHPTITMYLPFSASPTRPHTHHPCCSCLSRAKRYRGMEDSIITAKFAHSLAFAIHPISPSLAARHASRGRLLHPQIQTLHADSAHSTTSTCSRCGLYLLDGTGQVRSIRTIDNPNHNLPSSSSGSGSRSSKPRRSKHSNTRRFVQRTCAACGHVERIPRSVGSAVLFPKVRGRALQASCPSVIPANSVPGSIATSASASASKTASPTPAPSSSRSTPIPVPCPNPNPRVSTPPSLPPAQIQSQSSAPQSQPHSGPVSQSQAQPPPSKKARAKKKTGLQEMLARNKEKQERKQGGAGDSGLASFLSNL